MGNLKKFGRSGAKAFRGWIAGITAVCLLTGAAGCGMSKDVNAEGSVSEYKEHLEISLAYWQIDSFLSKRGEDAVLEALEEKFNITIVPRNVTWDDYNNKIHL